MLQSSSCNLIYHFREMQVPALSFAVNSKLLFTYILGQFPPFSLVPTSFSNLRCRDRISPLSFFPMCGGRPSGGGKYWAIFSEGGGGGPSWTPPKPILYLDKREDRPPDRPQLLKKEKKKKTVATLTPKISLAPSTRAASRKGRNRTKSLLGVHKGSSKR